MSLEASWREHARKERGYRRLAEQRANLLEQRRDRWRARAEVAEARVEVLELALKIAMGSWRLPGLKERDD